ncbi:MAG: UDP-N-acetylmuramoyl-L-alanine--D-glutamate ligase [Candidatus Omnitrophica bacterium]|nr:UDP-N-acetylmuramoyl-L-alanine--D-glutamate ligase [Candidatus Omnitrophota bacterium]
MAGKDLIVVSPGVPSHLSFLKRAKERGIPVIGEIELGYLLSASPIIAVTGTNGKSTVTTLIGKVLEKAGIPNIVCGNIGNPFTGELEKLNRRVYTVLEISSFQLENIVSFRPWIGVVLNITPDHLDRYRSFREYVEAKERIFLNQNSEDYLVLNYGDEVVRKFADKAKSKIIFFNEPGEKKDLTENQKVVLKVCSLMGISEETAFSVFQSFSGLPHRCEFVTEIEGVKFINDSKATNIHSTRYSLTSFREKVILIAGGRDKGQDFTGIREWLRDKVKYLLLIGEGAEKIEKAVGDSLPLGRFTHLEEAVDYAYSIAQKGDIVLLSPMCASFDMFEDYAHRGLVFKEKVLELKKKTEILSGHLVIPAQTVT